MTAHNAMQVMVTAELDQMTTSRSSGKERDTETGLDYFGARYFGSSMGRFTSVDPFNAILRFKKRSEFDEYLSQPQNWNAYAYVWNNPLRNTDPTGETVYVVTYTTGNSHGDEELKRAAQTKKDQITSSKGFDPKKDKVILAGVKTKADFQNVLSAAAKIGNQYGATATISLFSHAGQNDGPTFHNAETGKSEFFTNQELSNLKVNWGTNSTAAFYGCRTAENFAQNFANAQGVSTFGFVGGVNFSGNANSVSKWYLINGQFDRYMVDKGEQGLQERDPQ